MGKWLLALVLCLVSCGGGGSGSEINPNPVVPRTEPVLVGYFFGCMTDMLEQTDHVNLWWATGVCGGSGVWYLDMAQELQAARGAGIKNVVLMMPDALTFSPASNIDFQFAHLEATGRLAGFDTIAVYPTDEPDLHGHDDVEMTALFTTLRTLLAKYPMLSKAKLAEVYNCASGQQPGITKVDWVGCDDYNKGCGAIAELASFPVTSAQRLLEFPGGADPWRQDPTCFANYAQNNGQVAAVVPFIWQTEDGHRGIRENGMKATYCAMGRKLLNLASSSACAN